MNLNMGEKLEKKEQPTKKCECRGIRYCLLCHPEKFSLENVCARAARICFWCSSIESITKTDDWQLVVDRNLWMCKKCTDSNVDRCSTPTAPIKISCNQLRHWLLTGCCSDAIAGSIPQDFLLNEFLPKDHQFGITIFPDAISPNEEERVLQHIEESTWVQSQSGRRKQDYGVQVNFARRKVKLNKFSGLPAFSKSYLIPKFDLNNESKKLLSGFIPAELCNLEYIPERGSVIAPHFDDTWLWGERIITFNLASGTYLTFSCEQLSAELRVPLPQRGMVVFHGVCRYLWKHAIHREDIHARRIAVTLRELSSTFRELGESAELGDEIIRIASTYTGRPISDFNET